MRIYIENVRTFSGDYEIDIPPIAFLIGENSTGKTTILNLISVMSNPETFPFRPSFNQQPYDMGNFNNIATQKRGRGGNSREFSIGYIKNYLRKSQARIQADYQDKNGIPSLSSVSLSFGESKIILSKDGDNYSCEFDIEGMDRVNFLVSFPDIKLGQRFHLNEIISTLILRSLRSGEDAIEREDFLEMYRSILRAFPNKAFAARRTIWLAPIRSKPRRTYDEFNEDFSPEGGHVPFLMSRMLNDNDLNEEFISIFRDYGRNSGLFDDIKTKRLGNSASDPFQIIVKKGSRESNIVDVGYGLSQVIPIVAECIAAGEGTRILMQQPEVHLHPKAQAALGDLISILHSKKKQHYVIETHSDYLIDRIRYEVMKGRISTKDVGIIYLEKDKSDTNVFQLRIDKNANVLDAPESYRSFFLKEQFRLIGLDEIVA